jgi:hypothetical protein
MGSSYVSSRGGGRRPQLPAFCRTRRPSTTTVRLSSLLQHLCRPLVQAFARRLRSNKRTAMDLRRYT